MSEQRFNRFRVTNGRLVHFLSSSLPLSIERAYCGVIPDKPDTWRTVAGDKRLPPGKGDNLDGLPDCHACVKAYERMQKTGETVKQDVAQIRMF